MQSSEELPGSTGISASHHFQGPTAEKGWSPSLAVCKGSWDRTGTAGTGLGQGWEPLGQGWSSWDRAGARTIASGGQQLLAPGSLPCTAAGEGAKGNLGEQAHQSSSGGESRVGKMQTCPGAPASSGALVQAAASSQAGGEGLKNGNEVISRDIHSLLFNV